MIAAWIAAVVVTVLLVAWLVRRVARRAGSDGLKTSAAIQPRPTLPPEGLLVPREVLRSTGSSSDDVWAALEAAAAPIALAYYPVSESELTKYRSIPVNAVAQQAMVKVLEAVDPKAPTLFRVVLPKGAELVKAVGAEGFRGFSRTGGTTTHAVLKPVAAGGAIAAGWPVLAVAGTVMAVDMAAQREQRAHQRRVEAALARQDERYYRERIKDLRSADAQLSRGITLLLDGCDPTAMSGASTSSVSAEHRDDPDPARRHVIPMDWRRTDIPRTAIHQDLLYSLGAFMTICEIRRNDAARRLEHLMKEGVDPGARPGVVQEDEATEAEVATTSSGLDLERVSLDRIQAYIAERFAGHGLARLVGAVLEAEGFVCQVADPGPDGGIDIYAGRGPLGLDSPRLIVQVKSSPTPVDAKVVRELHGVLSTHGADQALLVAWGDVTKAAKQELRNQFFKVRVWSADDLLDALMRTYPSLDEDLRAELPLKQIWTLVEDDE